MEATDRVFSRNVAIAPTSFVLGAGDRDQGEAHPVRIGERQNGFAEALFERFVGDTLLDEAVGPIADRARGNPEGSLLGLTDASAAGRCAFPREEGEDGAGMAGFVAVIEVIGTRIVEIDGLLDEAEPKRPSIKVVISQGVTGYCRHMMDA